MKNIKLVFKFNMKTTISFSPNNSSSYAWKIIQHLDRKDQQEVIQLEAYFLQNVHCCLLKANELHLQMTFCIDVPWHNNKPPNSHFDIAIKGPYATNFQIKECCLFESKIVHVS
jgi:hypothetical protein